MKPVKRSEHNDTFIGERKEGEKTVLPGVGDLSVKKQQGDYGPEVVSHWQPSEEELAILNQGGCVRLTLITPRIPAISVGVDHKEETNGVTPD